MSGAFLPACVCVSCHVMQLSSCCRGWEFKKSKRQLNGCRFPAIICWSCNFKCFVRQFVRTDGALFYIHICETNGPHNSLQMSERFLHCRRSLLASEKQQRSPRRCGMRVSTLFRSHDVEILSGLLRKSSVFRSATSDYGPEGQLSLSPLLSFIYHW